MQSSDLSKEIDISNAERLPQFDSNRSLKILIHGWNADRNNMATIPVRNAYLVQNRHNLLVADWSSIAGMAYSTARELVRPIGYRIGVILDEFMHRMSINYDQLHVVGHSLGAHVAGNVGKYFGGRLARITALDPAGPLFVSHSVDAVGSSDALFVDAIHTDGLVLGEVFARAHVDFYPNRGIPSQPGCERLDIITLNACSHYRSTRFFAESILLPYNFVAWKCGLKDILDNRSSECIRDVRNKDEGESIVVMGEHVENRTRGSYYLETSNSSPYGLGKRILRRHQR
ncbi:pancreatic triacylglycerol lipase-like [Malaya genurostris]|uniref:pancreatic triacylglycerol lipase-like n=1 Tax=Malaya genurostris TaxID=325434 RepID=UPI0026F3FE4B|nr:pancreatic triacylglycerol lipase-like [Malaya genurostris]